MIASLPMYDWPELATSTDALWQQIRDQLHLRDIDAPPALSRSSNDEEFWSSPDLLLSQTCGYPLSTRLKGKVQYVATPEYSVAGCEDALYSSAIIAAKDSELTLNNWSGKQFAFNSTMSLSGYRCIRAMVGDPDKFFGSMIESGGHRQSARIVANGKAGIAAIDAVCWHHLLNFEPQTAGKLTILGWTAMRPALPFITSINTSQKLLDDLRQVVCDVLPKLASIDDTRALAIKGCNILDIADYHQLSTL